MLCKNPHESKSYVSLLERFLERDPIKIRAADEAIRSSQRQDVLRARWMFNVAVAGSEPVCCCAERGE
jgi:hypothetical protein